MGRRGYKKYRNVEVMSEDGLHFHSKKEHARYVELRLLEQGGQIHNLELQPKYVLQEGFRDWTGKAQREIAYVGDFRYVDEVGNVVVEDVKGQATQAFKIKWKLAMKRYPEIRWRLV